MDRSRLARLASLLLLLSAAFHAAGCAGPYHPIGQHVQLLVQSSQAPAPVPDALVTVQAVPVGDEAAWQARAAPALDRAERYAGPSSLNVGTTGSHGQTRVEVDTAILKKTWLDSRDPRADVVTGRDFVVRVRYGGQSEILHLIMTPGFAAEGRQFRVRVLSVGPPTERWRGS